MISKYFLICVFVSCIKLGFYKSYISTDFEVHRNWLAITHSLPISKWYFEETSEWTLDYPPLFGWFEYGLSYFARYFDKNMLNIDFINYKSENTILFQKLSVIFSDIVYLFAVYKLLCCKPISKRISDSLYLLLTGLKLLAPFGLLLIDHIHFQYNGMLFGLLFLSIYYIVQKNYLFAGFWFAFLLNMKHIYLYYAPAFGIFLLLAYCFKYIKLEDNSDPKEMKQKCVFVSDNLLKMSGVVLTVFGISFGPFISEDQLNQVTSRLFPFDKRGLTHAYWAPNFWSLYNTGDLILSKLGISDAVKYGSMTRGLVENYSHVVLPSVSPFNCSLLTLIFNIPIIFKLIMKFRMNQLTHLDFLKALIISGWSSFMFGWHVHEKAILMVSLPFMILELFETEYTAIGFVITTLAHFSLLPLIPVMSDYNLKMSLFFATTATHYVHSQMVTQNSLSTKLHPSTMYYIIIGIPLITIMTDYYLPIHYASLQFAPLLLRSVYCSAGLFLSFLRFYLTCWTDDYCWIDYSIDNKLFSKQINNISAEKKIQ